MDLQKLVPLIIYDNHCYLCLQFARIVNFFSKGRISIVGHYTELGQKLRESVLDSSALEMFWFVDGKIAYGGRAGIFPLILAIIRAKKSFENICLQDSNELKCKTTKAVFFRSASLLTNSKKIKIK